MKDLRWVNRFVMDKLKGKIPLTPVVLKYPFPERPVRTLGLVKIEGEVYSSERFIRILLMKVTIHFLREVYSIYFNPRLEYDLPVFTSDIVIKGKERFLVLDIHRRGERERSSDAPLFEKLMAIRSCYPSLFRNETTLKGPIQNIFSRAACIVNIKEDLDGEALQLLDGYLTLFLDTVEGAVSLEGEALEQAQMGFDRYLRTVVDNDPGVRVYTRLFGRKGGVARARDLFFGQ